MPQSHRAFSLIEVLISILVIAVLMSLLLPVLTGARQAGYRSVCAANQRQLGLAFFQYVQDNKETLPQYAASPEQSDWRYGGATVVSGAAPSVLPPTLDSGRPINRYITNTMDIEASADSVRLFSCPADRGVFARTAESATRPAPSLLERGTCFREFGTSYRANAILLGVNSEHETVKPRAMKLSEIAVNPSRLLLLGDAAWYFAVQPARSEESMLDASWHQKRDAGNMLAVDGSTRFLDFADQEARAFTLQPRGE